MNIVTRKDLIEISRFIQQNSGHITVRQVIDNYENRIETDTIQEVLDFMIRQRSININEETKMLVWLE